MAYLLPHLHSGWEVDQAIVSEEDRVIVIRFGRDQDPACMVQDEVLMSIADKVKNFAVIYLVRGLSKEETLWLNLFAHNIA
jgi:DIM1 family U5 snRNP protein